MKQLLILLVFLSSCVSTGKDVPLPEVEGIDLVLLFEHDGCKVYRFRDGNSRFVYWSDCRGNINHESGSSKHPKPQTTLNN